MSGQSPRFRVVIAQDCAFESRIETTEIDPQTHEYSIPKPGALFKDECQFGAEEETFSCRSGGKTVLSGSVYKLTDDASPSCKGDMFGHRYTCVKGCTKDVPRYLDIAPYEC